MVVLHDDDRSSIDTNFSQGDDMEFEEIIAEALRYDYLKFNERYIILILPQPHIRLRDLSAR